MILGAEVAMAVYVGFSYIFSTYYLLLLIMMMSTSSLEVK